MSAPLVVSILWLAGMALLVSLSIWLSDGQLHYTLDDPYIHLAVAETILQGGYGINSSELSAPSSSLVYPLLLVVTEAFGLGQLGPLVLNIMASGLAVFWLAQFADRRVLSEGPRTSLVAVTLFVALVFGMNALGLPMTGMEHSWHVLLCVLVLTELVNVAEDGRMAPWLLAAIVLLPLVRFEGIALALSSLMALWWLGHRRQALTGLAVCGTLLLLQVAVFVWAGLPALPSSVMVKSDVAASFVDGSGVWALAAHAVDNVVGLARTGRGRVLMGMLAGIALLYPRLFRARSREPAPFVVATTVGCALAAHLVAGQVGHFSRYGVYATALGLIATVYLNKNWLNRIANEGGRLPVLGLLVAVAVIIAPYVKATYKTPLAARGIYEQQYQMHRFAVDFAESAVAVNDLGWVSYQNTGFVLDLVGLGSESVRRARAEGRYDADFISESTLAHEVEYAMIYDHWFADVIPDSWIKVAVLQTIKVSADNASVQIYATSPAFVDPLRAALTRFAPTLPERSSLRFVDSSRAP